MLPAIRHVQPPQGSARSGGLCSACLQLASRSEGATLPSGENLALNTFLPPPPAFLTHALPSSYFCLQPLEVGTGRDPCSHFTDGEPTPKSGKVRARESYFMQAERKQPEALLHEETLRPLQRRLCEGWGGQGGSRAGQECPSPRTSIFFRCCWRGEKECRLHTGHGAWRSAWSFLLGSIGSARLRPAAERGGVGGPAGGGGGEEEAEERACGAPSAHELLWPR